MADAQELICRLPKRDNVFYNGLALNPRGVERAYESGLQTVEISLSASDTHSRKNAGLTFVQALEAGRQMARMARRFGMIVIASVQCAFGCIYEGRAAPENVLHAVRMYAEEKADRISLADTTGMGHPLLIKERVRAVQSEIGDIPLGLHLHDTMGLGLVNLMAGLECGLRFFDTAFGGMGGCPFVPGAAGNIATEDTVRLLETLNIQTGIDRKKVAECSRQMAAFLEKPLPGKLYNLESCL
jgi:hydroxymethylglutaryl-CoA lyase